MHRPDPVLDALRILDDLCWENAERTGDGWATIAEFQRETGVTYTYAGRRLLRLLDRGWAERRWRLRPTRTLIYGVTDAGAERLLEEDAVAA